MNKSTDIDRQLIRRVLRKLGTSIKEFDDKQIDMAISKLKRTYKIQLKDGR